MIRAIAVRDGNGDELLLYEYEVGPSAPTMSLGRSASGTRLALDTGEAVRQLDDDHFTVVVTGETLTRIR